MKVNTNKVNGFLMAERISREGLNWLSKLTFKLNLEGFMILFYFYFEPAAICEILPMGR